MNMGHKRKTEDTRRNKGNPVAKNMNKFNVPKTHGDKKYILKMGKHKYMKEIYNHEA